MEPYDVVWNYPLQQGKIGVYLILGRETTRMAGVASGTYLTCHQYNPGKSDNIGHRQDPTLQDSWSSPSILMLYSLALMDLQMSYSLLIHRWTKKLPCQRVIALKVTKRNIWFGVPNLENSDPFNNKEAQFVDTFIK